MKCRRCQNEAKIFKQVFKDGSIHALLLCQKCNYRCNIPREFISADTEFKETRKALKNKKYEEKILLRRMNEEIDEQMSFFKSL